jgi:hypothetical protein
MKYLLHEYGTSHTVCKINNFGFSFFIHVLRIACIIRLQWVLFLIIIYFENEIEEEEMNDVLIRRSNVCSLTWGGTIRAHLSRGSSFHPGHENYLRWITNTKRNEVSFTWIWDISHRLQNKQLWVFNKTFIWLVFD